MDYGCSMNELIAQRYRISLRLIKLMPAIGPDEHFGQTAEFHAESLDGSSLFDYEGNGMGGEFKRRCDYLIRKGSIIVEVPQSICDSHLPMWKEDTINFALNQIALVTRIAATKTPDSFIQLQSAVGDLELLNPGIIYS